MKRTCLIVLLVVGTCALVLTQEQENKAEKWRKECEAAAGATPEDRRNAAANTRNFDDTKMRKYILCIYEKTGMISESAGDINIETVKIKLRKNGATEDQITEIMKCAVKKDTPEATAFALATCIFKHMGNFTPY